MRLYIQASTLPTSALPRGCAFYWMGNIHHLKHTKPCAAAARYDKRNRYKLMAEKSLTKHFNDSSDECSGKISLLYGHTAFKCYEKRIPDCRSSPKTVYLLRSICGAADVARCSQKITATSS